MNEISTDISQLSQTVRNGNELILESISSGNNRLFDAFEYNIKNRSNRSISLHKLNSEISENNNENAINTINAVNTIQSKRK